MVTEDRFKLKLSELDSASRTCVLFLLDRINKLRVQKIEIPPEIVKAINLHEEKISKLIDINNIVVETLDNLEIHYKNTMGLDKRISDFVLKDIRKELIANKIIMEENIAKANMEFRKIEEIRDGILDKFIIIAKRLNIDLSLTEKGSV